MTETTREKDKAIWLLSATLNKKFLDLFRDTGIIASYLATTSINLFKQEKENQYRFFTDHNRDEVNEFLKSTEIPVPLYSYLIFYRVTNKLSSRKVVFWIDNFL